jgi:hypothetical protein
MSRLTITLAALAANLVPHVAVADWRSLPSCPKAFVARWLSASTPDVHSIPAKKCLLQGATGAHVCIRDKGCLNLGPYDEDGNPRE